ncbi:MAG: hypothetical protein HY738_23025, partial [Bacteroidia bacterium]|nr:hypothetical protein [Bacteroidia bacterium]
SARYSFACGSDVIIPCIYKFTTPSSDQNYIRTIVTRLPLLSISNSYNHIGTINEYINYYDGLGRESQLVSVKASPDGQDIIVPMVYDAIGRQQTEYLPYTACSSGLCNINAVADQSNYYINPPNTIPTTNYPITEKIFDNSPLNRIMKQSAPGETWRLGNGHTMQIQNNFNSSNEVRYWYVDQGTGNCMNNGFYSQNQLYKTTTIDENGYVFSEYTDKSGKLILKNYYDASNSPISRYFVYDEFEQISYIIPPQAIKEMTDINDFTMTTNPDFIYKWLFIFKYDIRKRLVEKKVPGNESVLYIYDKLDRLVFEQDGNMRENDQWKFYKYDCFGRLIMTGLNGYYYQLTRQAIQSTYVDVWPNLYESRTNQNYSVQHGYTNVAFPDITQGYNEIHTVNYYDDYDFDCNGNPDYSYAADSEFPENTPSYYVKNKVTGTKTRLLGQNLWVISVNFYDKYDNIIQVYSTNHLNGTDRITNKYSFTHELLKSKSVHTVPGKGNITIKKRFVFDHIGRLVNTYQQNNDDAEILLSENKYNQIGQKVEENLHKAETGTTFLQSVDYRYNIRGWLTNINNRDLIVNSQNDDSNDLFGMDIFYEQGNNALNSLPQYNGNIASIYWKSTHNSNTHAYGFTYDKLNRINSAKYGYYLYGSGWTGNANRYNEQNIIYDDNGNILTLVRNGAIGINTYGIMDDLTYYYKGNQLIGANDAVNDLAGVTNFNDNGNNSIPDIADESTYEYLYDFNGNMIEDKNKGIQSITYNILNLPEIIDFGSNNKITYTYDANRKKLQKKVYNPGLIYTKDYIDNFVYHNNTIEYILTDKGRSLPETDGIFTYEYFLMDHLGSVRVSFKDIDHNGIAEECQENHYYPFGTSLGGMNWVSSYSSSTNKYLFQGQDLQDDLNLGLYQFKWRFYDAVLGRFVNPDPMANLRVEWTSYNAMWCNPILNVDPDGRWADKFEYALNKESGEYELKNRVVEEGPHYAVVVDQSGKQTSDRFYFKDQEIVEQDYQSGAMSKFNFDYKSLDYSPALENIMEKSGVNKPDNGFFYAYKESPQKGKMDYATKYLKDKTVYARGMYVYNKGYFGNYLWGQGMHRLGIGLEISMFGAQGNNWKDWIWEGLGIKSSEGKSNYGGVEFWDSDADQGAIMWGWYNW